MANAFCMPTRKPEQIVIRVANADLAFEFRDDLPAVRGPRLRSMSAAHQACPKRAGVARDE